MNESVGLLNLWQEGDWVSRSVAIFLLLMSIISWVVIAIKLVNLVILKRQAKLAEEFWHRSDFNDALTCLGENNHSPWRLLAIQGHEAVRHHQNRSQQLHDALSLSDWVTRILRNTLDSVSAQLSSGLAILASVGSTAPFIGLFGTVWGIYHALIGLSGGGMTSIDKVAGPIGEALIMTAFGLVVAIPAVLGYNALSRANKSVNDKLCRFAHDLHALFITGARVIPANQIDKERQKRID